MKEILRKRFKKARAWLLVLLFIGYYGSVTLFYHSHIVLGDTIVHSHPYKSDSNGKPLHNHSEKGYLTVHLLSSLFVTATVLFFIVNTVTPTAIFIFISIREGAPNHFFHYFYSLRGPPSGMLI